MSQRDYGILDEFFSFVRPVRYPVLSTYCKQLTGISQKDVDTAPTFPNVLANFVEWLGDPSQYSFCSWGEFDQFLLMQSCRFHRVSYPFDSEYIDIRPEFSEVVSGRNVSMPRALEMLGLTHEGRLHRGIDDARNIARIWQVVLRGVMS